MLKFSKFLAALAFVTAPILPNSLAVAQANSVLPVESEIFVEAVTGLSSDFIRGVDIGSILAQENSGVTFYNWDGEEQDIFQTLAESGVNLVRIRIWNDPFDNEGRGFGGGNNDVEAAIEIGRRAKEHGMGVQLNFHYSDFWADPGKQQSPRAWEGMNLEERTKALHDFTYESVRQIIEAGVDVWQVQIGNETNSGMAGVSGWNQMIPLFRAGSEAVRAIDPEIQIVVHFTNPDNPGHFMNAANQLAQGGVDFDVFGASYYSFWHGSLENLTNVLSDVAAAHNVDVMVVETSYAFTAEDGDGHPNVVPGTGQTLDYPISVQGQANKIRDVFQAVADVPNGRGIGVIYWEPAWIPVGPASDWENNRILWETYGSGWASSFAAVYDPYDAGMWYGGSAWDNQGMFDFNGRPLASLNVFRYVDTGAMPASGIVMETVLSTSSSIVRAADLTPDTLLGKLPSQVYAVYIDNARSLVDVTWNAFQVEEALRSASEAGGIQTFTISGTVVEVATGNEFDALLNLTLLPENLVANPSFENSDMSMWRVVFEQGGGANRGTDNPRTGDYGFRFWYGSTFNWTLEQDISIDRDGYYAFEVFAQGGWNQNLYSFIRINGEPLLTEAFAMTGWMNWANPVIEGIRVYAGDVVTVGVRVQGQSGDWGTFDDFYFYLIEALEIEEDEINNDVPPYKKWNSSSVFNARDRVVYDGRVFEAQWWIQGQAPSAGPWGSWMEIGSLVYIGNGDYAYEWTDSRVFDNGDIVVYNRKIFRARWWTRNQNPNISPELWELIGYVPSAL